MYTHSNHLFVIVASINAILNFDNTCTHIRTEKHYIYEKNTSSNSSRTALRLVSESERNKLE